MNYRAYEFFAGGGMARCGLGGRWLIPFANDIDEKKAESYTSNHDTAILIADVAHISLSELPGTADLVWASFPCQDLSLAGKGVGLSGKRSGTFWPFWRLMQALNDDGRKPRIIAIENVCGLLTSNGGSDFATLVNALCEGGYRVGACVIDAALFVPQSRPRLFITAICDELKLPSQCTAICPDEKWTTSSLDAAVAALPQAVTQKWFWPSFSAPCSPVAKLHELIEHCPSTVRWDDAADTRYYLSLMSPLNKAKVDAARRSRSLQVGAMYRRTRPDGQGGRCQRFEVRFDGIAGCLRTPSGGSSRQKLLFIENGLIRSRLLSPREAARLMGLPDDYALPGNYNEAYHLLGDGVVASVVRHLAKCLFEPTLQANEDARQAA